MQNKTFESQYMDAVDADNIYGREKLGFMSNDNWINDPRRLLFSMSRYKFVSKMFSGFDEVLEVGCGDAFGCRLVQQSVGSLTAIDIDPMFIKDAEARKNPKWPIKLMTHDILKEPLDQNFDGIYSLDVLEHISSKSENVFMDNIVKMLNKNGVFIVGMPSLESQYWASPQSKAGHINCKTGKNLKELLARYFGNVFIFSMNDEVVHTGFMPMSHYLFGLCCSKKN